MIEITDFRVEPADYNADFEDLRSIRETVFMSGQNNPEKIGLDPIAPDSYHVVARDNQHNAIGVAQLSPDRKISHMAVLEHWQRKGVGKALVAALLDKAQKLGFPDVTLFTQKSALGFYEKAGFIKEDTFATEANIPLQLMHLKLKPKEKSGRPPQKPRESAVEISEIKTPDELITASLSLVKKARKQICIFTPDLEPTLYGNKEMVEALKQFAIGCGGGNILIIVQDTLTVRNQPHPLLDIAQRLPSIFLFRTPIEAEDLQYPSAFVVNDRDGYVFRQKNFKTLGVWSPSLPARNRQLSEEFERVWQRSVPCTEFRALGI